MTEFPKYPKLLTLWKRPEILAVKQVRITEKLHGTNFRIHIPPGATSPADIILGSRNRLLNTSERQAEFYKGLPCRHVHESIDLSRFLAFAQERCWLAGGVTLFGEMIGAAIQKGTTYLPDRDTVTFRPFDLMVGNTLQPWSLLESVCGALNLQTVPVLGVCESNKEMFEAYLNTFSAEASRSGSWDASKEGIVIRSEPLLRTHRGEWLIVKHKTERFQEEARLYDRDQSLEQGEVEEFAETYVTRGRVCNAMTRLRDTGFEPDGSMKDLKHLAPEVSCDIFEEEREKWEKVKESGFEDRAIHKALRRQTQRVYTSILAEETYAASLH